MRKWRMATVNQVGKAYHERREHKGAEAIDRNALLLEHLDSDGKEGLR